MKYLLILICCFFLASSYKAVAQEVDKGKVVYDQAVSLAKSGNAEGSIKLAKQIPNGLYKMMGFMDVSKELINNGNANYIEKIIKPILDSLVTLDIKGNQSLKASYNNYSLLYARALFKNNKLDDALKYVKPVYENQPYRNISTSELYISILKAASKDKEALTIMKEMIAEGSATALINESVKPTYIKVNGGDKGFDHMIDSLKVALKSKTSAAILKELISVPAPDFTLKDTDGKEVVLSKLKGKTVIIDFWATWCVPCKKSFPAMKMVVEKYKNDPSVVFLFIHTWEREENATQSAKQYIADNHYPFRVLMDLKDPQTKKCNVVTAFGISGIPGKFIIDKNENIRFKVIGMNANNSDETTAEEISMMIELAKAN